MIQAVLHYLGFRKSRIGMRPTSQTKMEINLIKSLLHQYRTTSLNIEESNELLTLMHMSKYCVPIS
jgi:hypothetical protein